MFCFSQSDPTPLNRLSIQTRASTGSLAPLQLYTLHLSEVGHGRSSVLSVSILMVCLEAAMYLVNSSNMRDSFASEFSADWALTEGHDVSASPLCSVVMPILIFYAEQPSRVLSWTAGLNRYRVHIADDSKILFLSFLINFSACLLRATQFKQEFERQVMSYLYALPQDLRQTQGLVINDRGRVEQVAGPFVQRPPPADPPMHPPSPPR